MDTHTLRFIRVASVVAVSFGVGAFVLGSGAVTAVSLREDVRPVLLEAELGEGSIFLIGGDPAQVPALSEEEQREYDELLQSIQQKLNSEAESLLKFQSGYWWVGPNPKDAYLSEILSRWLITISYVNSASVQPALFMTDPLQFRTQLQIQLRSKKTVFREVMLTFPLQPRLSH